MRARGAQIEQMYSPSGVVTQFTRDVAYVRPGTFVVYDRTTAADGSADQWTAWHVPGTPTQSASSDGSLRFDVPTGGTIRSLLPQAREGGDHEPAERGHAHRAALEWRLAGLAHGGLRQRSRPRSSACRPQTVTSPPERSSAPTPSGARAKASCSSRRTTRDATQTTGADYEVTQSTDADHMLFDVAPGSYDVTAAAGAAGKLMVRVKAGGSLKPSANGTLAFTVNTTGAVTATAAPPPTTPTGAATLSTGATNAVVVLSQQAQRAVDAPRTK